MTTNELPAPIESNGMNRVSATEFYAKIGPINVHPRISGSWKHGTGYTQIWELQSGPRTVMGISDGASRYWLMKR